MRPFSMLMILVTTIVLNAQQHSTDIEYYFSSNRLVNQKYCTQELIQGKSKISRSVRSLGRDHDSHGIAVYPKSINIDSQVQLDVGMNVYQLDKETPKYLGKIGNFNYTKWSWADGYFLEIGNDSLPSLSQNYGMLLITEMNEAKLRKQHFAKILDENISDDVSTEIRNYFIENIKLSRDLHLVLRSIPANASADTFITFYDRFVNLDVYQGFPNQQVKCFVQGHVAGRNGHAYKSFIAIFDDEGNFSVIQSRALKYMLEVNNKLFVILEWWNHGVGGMEVIEINKGEIKVTFIEGGFST